MNTKTSIAITNEKTKNETKEAATTVLRAKSPDSIGNRLQNRHRHGQPDNEEPTSKVHRVKGIVEAKFTSCTAPKPAFGCKVKEPISVSSNVEGVEGPDRQNAMGLEFKPTGEHFASVTLEGCFIAGTFNTDGTAIATSNTSNTGKFTGATSVFTAAMTKETLKLAGNPAEVESSTTVSKAGGGNPIALTTVT